MNKAIFIGNLVRAPELKEMQNRKSRCTFTLAVARPYTNAQGNRDADFIGFTAYDKNAENAQKYLAKGRKVAIESHVKTGSYENNDGKRVYTTEFIVDHFEFLPFGQQRNQSDDTPQGAASYQNQSFTPVDDDELPF